MNKTELNSVVKGCLRGKTNAQKELYDQFSKDMFKICLMYGKDYDKANDLLQEGFIKVFHNLHKYDTHGALGGWIRRVIVNVCIDAHRADKWSKNRQSLEESIEYELQDEDPLDPGQIYERDDFLRIIKGLPTGYSTILNLYFLEEMKHAEIAEKLDISVGTSKSQLFKAKRYLKNILVQNLSKEELEKYEGFSRKEV
ncbi:MAG: RNA polymerase sigma factor (sigma-70 family) [Flavobacteriaceae bacterium]|jgi:RNA polymerase sigma factor (sigma-70 family)